MIHWAEFETLQMSLAGEVRLERMDQLKSEITQTEKDLAAARAAEAATTAPAGMGRAAMSATAPASGSASNAAATTASAGTQPRAAALPTWARAFFSGTPNASALDMRLRVLQSSLEAEKTPVEQQIDWAHWHDIIYRIYWIMPKTTETDDLIQRWLSIAARLPRQRDEQAAAMPSRGRNGAFATRGDYWMAVNRTDQVLGQRPAIWVIGTSVVFEGVVVSLAAWAFCRRDY